MRRTVLVALALGVVAYRLLVSREADTNDLSSDPEEVSEVASAQGDTGNDGLVPALSDRRVGDEGIVDSVTGLPATLPAAIPLETGLRLTYASSIDGQADWELIVMVERADSDVADLRIAWNRGAEGRWKAIERPLSRRERMRGRAFYAYAAENDTSDHRGFAYSMATSSVLSDLEASGRSEVAFLLPELASVPYRGTLSRTASTPEGFPMVLDGERVALPGIRARGRLYNPAGRVPWVDVELVLLDVPASPWFLDSEVRIPDGRGGGKRLVRIATAGAENDLDRNLRDRCVTSVHDIYFATASAELDSASYPTLERIAATLGANLDWQLRIVGHTDDIGSEEFNQELSLRRAERVRETLVRDYGIPSERLTADGRGEAEPLDDNATPEGRARNRRVDLERECDTPRQEGS